MFKPSSDYTYGYVCGFITGGGVISAVRHFFGVHQPGAVGFFRDMSVLVVTGIIIAGFSYIVNNYTITRKRP